MAEVNVQDFLRYLAHKWWVRNLRREAETWLERNGNKRADRLAIQDCFWRVEILSWFEWLDGRRPSF